MINDILIYAGICISGVILLILCAGMVTLGKIIANTPDGRELRGERIRDELSKNTWSSPENLPKVLAYAFGTLFVTGSVILVVSNENIIMLIIGGVTVFSAIFFASGTAFFEMLMYNQMVANLKEHKEYVKAINT